MSLLSVKDLSVRYGGVEAVSKVSLEVPQAALVTVIGANGAGKTSLLNAITGVVPKRGLVSYQGEDISQASPESLVAKGITLVPERRELFAALSVLDNLRLGAFHRYLKRDSTIRQDIERVFSIFPRLAERQKQLAGTMSGGEQQMLAVGRAMMSRPKLLLLDEPSLGLAPLIVAEIFRVISLLKSEGVTVLLIEQNARAALKLADYGYLMETGNILLGAAAKELIKDKRVAEAYLGLSH
ncbi:MAG: ABC transporter ATP-binding protein [Deinococcales bacterium]